MIYFTADNKCPLKYIEAAQLINSDHFLHSCRCLNFFVLIIVCDGTLYIEQNNKKYEVEPNQYILLFPGYYHGGYHSSDDYISYYWCHFELTEGHYSILSETEANQILFMYNHSGSNCQQDIYLIPEYGSIHSADRTSLMFRMLIDLSKQNCYSQNLLNYTLSLLLMHITQDIIDSFRLSSYMSQTHYKVAEIMEWVHANYNTDITVQKIADLFNYNADYLSSLFKKYTGMPLLRYINCVRISISKKILLDTNDSIKEVAMKVGFKNEKHYMKLFKKYEQTTPTTFKNIYYRKRLNRY